MRIDSTQYPWLADRHASTGSLALLVAAGAAIFAVVLQGDLLLTGLASAGLVFFALACWRPCAALGTLIAAVLLLEQYPIAGIESITAASPLYLNINNLSSFYLPANPLELLLTVLTGATLVRVVWIERRPWRWHWPQVATLCFGLSLAISFLLGMVRGGDFKVALWEVRAFGYLILLQLLVPQIVRHRRQLVWLTWALCVPLIVKGFQGVSRYFFTIDRRIDSVSAISSHECAFFLLCLFLLLGALWTYRAAPRLRWLLTATLPVTFVTFLLAQRRVAYGALAIGAVLFVVLAPRAMRKRVLWAAIPISLLLTLYAFAFWNKPYGTLSMPVRQVRSIFDPRPGSHEESSNDFRDRERFNLKTTIRANLVTGTGFGHEFYQAVPLPNINYPLYRFIPHNAILWLWAKSGTIGFFFFWLFVGANVVAAMMLRNRLRDPLARALSVTAALALLLQMIISTYDLQLTFYRNMVFHGTLLGLVGASVALAAEAKPRTLPPEEEESP